MTRTADGSSQCRRGRLHEMRLRSVTDIMTDLADSEFVVTDA